MLPQGGCACNVHSDWETHVHEIDTHVQNALDAHGLCIGLSRRTEVSRAIGRIMKTRDRREMDREIDREQDVLP